MKDRLENYTWQGKRRKWKNGSQPDRAGNFQIYIRLFWQPSHGHRQHPLIHSTLKYWYGHAVSRASFEIPAPTDDKYQNGILDQWTMALLPKGSAIDMDACSGPVSSRLLIPYAFPTMCSSLACFMLLQKSFPKKLSRYTVVCSIKLCNSPSS